MKMNPKWKFVEVVWEDAVSLVQWGSEENLPRIQTCTTRGWLVREELDYIVLCATVGENPEEENSLSEIIAIPMGCIQAFNELRIEYKGLFD